MLPFLFSDYPVLRDHFKEAHYLCEEGDCYDAQFTNAFRSSIDYKAHVATDHSKNMRKHQQRQARTLEIDFNLAPRPGASARVGGSRRDRRDHRDYRNDYGNFFFYHVRFSIILTFFNSTWIHLKTIMECNIFHTNLMM